MCTTVRGSRTWVKLQFTQVYLYDEEGKMKSQYDGMIGLSPYLDTTGRIYKRLDEAYKYTISLSLSLPLSIFLSFLFIHSFPLFISFSFPPCATLSISLFFALSNSFFLSCLTVPLSQRGGVCGNKPNRWTDI